MQAPAILPVPRPKREAKRLYDQISIFYDYLTAPFEQKHAEKALDRLSIKEGEDVLEIGFGTGNCLRRIAERVGQTGRAYGIDISTGMLAVAKRRLERTMLMDRVELCCGDAACLPYGGRAFDAVFMSFTLELFDTPEIPEVLRETRRVLKLGGRLGIASMSEEGDESVSLRLYKWVHKRWPKYVDCRPIYVEQALRDAGYEIKSRENIRFWGLSGEIIVALNDSRAKG